MSTSKYLLLIFFYISNALAAAPTDMVRIESGNVLPFFDRAKSGEKQKELVEAFYIDKYLVTNSDFLDFVKKNSEWRKSKILKIFADSRYLGHWQDDLDFSKGIFQYNPLSVIAKPSLQLPLMDKSSIKNTFSLRCAKRKFLQALTK